MGNGQQLNLSMQMNGPPCRLMDHLRTGIWPSLRQLSFILFTVAAIFAVHPAQAQPTGPSTCHLQSSATDPSFLQSLQTIITHGDLSDVPFIEKTMGIKFNVSYNSNEPGIASYQNMPASPFGSSILIRLDVDHATPNYFLPGSLGVLILDGDPNAGFTSDCPNMSASVFESFFGKGSAPGGPPGWSWIHMPGYPGKDGSAFDIEIALTNNALSRIVIAQSFPPSEIRPPPQPAYCKTSTLTGVIFLQRIKAIVDHGDLSNIGFLEKTLGTKFTVVNYPWQSTEYPVQLLTYNGAQTADNPLPVQITVWEDVQKRHAQQASIRFEAGYTQSGQSFLVDCLGLTRFQFFSLFGKQGFTISGSSPPSADFFSKTLNLPGKVSTKMKVTFSTSLGGIFGPPERGTVLDVTLEQSR